MVASQRTQGRAVVAVDFARMTSLRSADGVDEACGTHRHPSRSWESGLEGGSRRVASGLTRGGAPTGPPGLRCATWFRRFLSRALSPALCCPWNLRRGAVVSWRSQLPMSLASDLARSMVRHEAGRTTAFERKAPHCGHRAQWKRRSRRQRLEMRSKAVLRQKAPHRVHEDLPGGLIVDENVVAALERHEVSVRNPRSDRSPLFKWNALIAL